MQIQFYNSNTDGAPTGCFRDDVVFVVYLCHRGSTRSSDGSELVGRVFDDQCAPNERGADEQGRTRRALTSNASSAKGAAGEKEGEGLVQQGDVEQESVFSYSILT